MTKIKEARMALGITAAEAARRIGISRQRYSQYERGIYEANYEMLLRIGEAFGVSVDFLIDRKSTPRGNPQECYRGAGHVDVG